MYIVLYFYLKYVSSNIYIIIKVILNSEYNLQKFSILIDKIYF